MFSPQTVSLFQELLNTYQLPSNHPNFDTVARAISMARLELEAYHKIHPSKLPSSDHKDQTQEEVLAEQAED